MPFHTVIKILLVAGLCSLASSVNSQTSGHPAREAQVTTAPGVMTHAVEDAKAALKIAEQQTRQERHATARRFARTLISDSEVSTALKTTARDNPQSLLALNPSQLRQSDKLPYDIYLQQSLLDPAILPIPIRKNGLELLESNENQDALVDAVMKKSAELMDKSRSVGRIEITRQTGSLSLVGTAFVVAPGYMMTACHVAKEVAHVSQATN